MNTYHIPIMVDEIVTGLRLEQGKKYIDATVGGGGHGWEIVRRGGILLGIDADSEAVQYTKEKFRIQNLELRIKKTWKIVQGNFRDLEEIAKREGFEGVDGVLFDLGVSSRQLDDADKGFTYRSDGARLDMRFDQAKGETAADVIKRGSEHELNEIFTTFGEEERAGAIARAIVGARKVKGIETAGDMRRIVKEVVGERGANEVLSRIFQALRMYVNDEVGALKEGLEGAKGVLTSGGRIAVLTFHSIEDRFVKQCFLKDGWVQVTKKPIRPTFEEQKVNKRSRSAKLRIAKKL